MTNPTACVCKKEPVYCGECNGVVFYHESSSELEVRFEKQCVGTVNGTRVAFIPVTKDFIRAELASQKESFRRMVVEKGTKLQTFEDRWEIDLKDL